MQVAVITGGASGIGEGLARQAVARGMQVVLADRDAPGLARVAEELGATVLPVVTDVTRAEALQALADQTYAAFGQVDLLFNNAGVLSTGHCWELGDAQWQLAWQVNVNGIVNGLRAFVPRLLAAQRPARIVNTASVGGFLPSPLMGPYSTTKFAVVALTECLAGELAALDPRIRVSLLAPGPVKTRIFRETPAAASEDFHQQMQQLLAHNGLDSDSFAQRVFEAIDQDQYWIVPQPEMFDPLLEQRHAMIASRSHPDFSWTPR
jgi:NAD(P)-dependent dehydrogenase (short-subunit alcohol dehydrogenase family)